MSIYQLSSDHCEGLNESQYAEAIVTALSQSFKILVPRSWTGYALKQYLADNHPGRPMMNSMRLVYNANVIKDQDSMDVLRDNWKEKPNIIYVIDDNIRYPTTEEVNETFEHAMKSVQDKKKLRQKKKDKKKKEEEKVKIYKKLRLPKSVYFSQSTFFLLLFIYLMWTHSNYSFIFWIVVCAVPFYYSEVKRNINDFYNKKLRELNIPYESESQKEIREREEVVKKRIENNVNSGKWDEEKLERKYSVIEIAASLVYYFVMSFFPAYIEKQLDIFQREFNMLDSKKRMREKRRDYEKRIQEEEEKKMKERDDGEATDQNVITSMPHQPSRGDDPLIEEYDAEVDVK
jgi:hypothetical protein